MIFFCHPILSKRPSQALKASWTHCPHWKQSRKSQTSFCVLVALLVSSCFWVWGTAFERCHELWSMCRDQKVLEREGASVSQGPDPEGPRLPSAGGWLDCTTASGLPSGAALFTHCPGLVRCFPLPSPRCRWLWACWRSRKCVFPTQWTVPMW